MTPIKSRTPADEMEILRRSIETMLRQTEGVDNNLTKMWLVDSYNRYLAQVGDLGRSGLDASPVIEILKEIYEKSGDDRKAFLMAYMQSLNEGATAPDAPASAWLRTAGLETFERLLAEALQIRLLTRTPEIKDEPDYMRHAMFVFRAASAALPTIEAIPESEREAFAASTERIFASLQDFAMVSVFEVRLKAMAWTADLTAVARMRGPGVSFERLQAAIQRLLHVAHIRGDANALRNNENFARLFYELVLSCKDEHERAEALVFIHSTMDRFPSYSVALAQIALGEITSHLLEEYLNAQARSRLPDEGNGRATLSESEEAVDRALRIREAAFNYPNLSFEYGNSPRALKTMLDQVSPALLETLARNADARLLFARHFADELRPLRDTNSPASSAERTLRPARIAALTSMHNALHTVIPAGNRFEKSLQRPALALVNMCVGFAAH